MLSPRKRPAKAVVRSGNAHLARVIRTFDLCIELVQSMREAPDRIITEKDRQTISEFKAYGLRLVADLRAIPHDVSVTHMNDEEIASYSRDLHLARDFLKDLGDAVFLHQLSPRNLTKWQAAQSDASTSLDTLIEAVSLEASQRKTNFKVPAQQPAPATFDVRDHRIVAVQEPDRSVADADRNNAVAARQSILTRGDALIADLRASNCDPRLTAALVELQARVAAETNIIDLGIAQMTASRLARAAAEELSGTLVGTLQAHVSLVGMYAAQFESWRKFTENAAIVALDAADIGEIGNAAMAVTKALEERPGLASPETPLLIKAIAELLDEPGEAGKRAGFALLRLLENLIAKAYEYSLALIDKTATKSIEGLSSAAAKVAVAGFLALSVGAAASLGGVAGKVAEVSWVKVARDVAAKELQQLAKP